MDAKVTGTVTDGKGGALVHESTRTRTRSRDGELSCTRTSFDWSLTMSASGPCDLCSLVVRKTFGMYYKECTIGTSHVDDSP